jgi:hypothetical protein
VAVIFSRLSDKYGRSGMTALWLFGAQFTVFHKLPE